MTKELLAILALSVSRTIANADTAALPTVSVHSVDQIAMNLSPAQRAQLSEVMIKLGVKVESWETIDSVMLPSKSCGFVNE